MHHLHPQNAERNAQHSTNSAHQESVVSDSPHEQWHQRKQVLDAERALKLAIQKGLVRNAYLISLLAGDKLTNLNSTVFVVRI